MNIGLEVLKENSIDIFDKNIDAVSLVIDICQTSNEIELELMHCHEMLIIHSYVKQYGVTESLNTLYDFSFEGIGKVISDIIAVIKEKLKKLGELFVKAYKWIKEKILKIKSKKQVKSDKYTVHYNPNDVIEYVNKLSNFFTKASIDEIHDCYMGSSRDFEKFDKRIEDLSKIEVPNKSNNDIDIKDSDNSNVCVKIVGLLNALESWIKECQRQISNFNASIDDFQKKVSNQNNDPDVTKYCHDQIEIDKKVISLFTKYAAKAVECGNKLTVIYNDYNNTSNDNSDTGFKSKYGDFPRLVKAIEQKDSSMIRAIIITLMDTDYSEVRDGKQKWPIALKVAMEVNDYLKKHKILDEPLFEPENGRANLPPVNEATADILHKVRGAMHTNFSIEKIKYNCDVIMYLCKNTK